MATDRPRIEDIEVPAGVPEGSTVVVGPDGYLIFGSASAPTTPLFADDGSGPLLNDAGDDYLYPD